MYDTQLACVQLVQQREYEEKNDKILTEFEAFLDTLIASN